jgi:hypothetical protein
MATIRVIRLEPGEERSAGPCVACGGQGQTIAYFARAY